MKSHCFIWTQNLNTKNCHAKNDRRTTCWYSMYTSHRFHTLNNFACNFQGMNPPDISGAGFNKLIVSDVQ